MCRVNLCSCEWGIYLCPLNWCTLTCSATISLSQSHELSLSDVGNYPRACGFFFFFCGFLVLSQCRVEHSHCTLPTASPPPPLQERERKERERQRFPGRKNRRKLNLHKSKHSSTATRRRTPLEDPHTDMHTRSI